MLPNLVIPMMQTPNPTTRVSLILRLHNPKDAEAWEEFVLIYQPFILRIAQRLGMSDANAADASQNTLTRLTEVVHQWSPSKTNATFRGWLYRVARNCMLRQFEKENKHMRLLQSEVSREYFDQLSAEPKGGESVYQLEFQRQVFASAAENIRSQIRHNYWQAFWLTYVKNRDIKEVAHMLKINVSTVYVARSRVLKRIRNEVLRMTKSGLIEPPGKSCFDKTMLTGEDYSDFAGS